MTAASVDALTKPAGATRDSATTYLTESGDEVRLDSRYTRSGPLPARAHRHELRGGVCQSYVGGPRR